MALAPLLLFSLPSVVDETLTKINLRRNGFIQLTGYGPSLRKAEAEIEAKTMKEH